MRTIIRAVIACAAMAGAMTCAAAITSRSYVQQGLVAQYDGIKNVGHDADHSYSTNIWVDLTGNGNDGACASQLSWSSDGWSVSGGCKPVTVPAPGLAATMGKGTFTIQFACTPSIDDKRQAFFSQYNYNSARGGLGLEHNNGSSKIGKIRYYKHSSFYPSDDKLDYLSGATISKDVFTSASFAMSPTEQKCWLNGTLADTRTGSLKGVSSSCPSVIGGEPQAASARTGSDYTAGYGVTFQGEYNAFRLYSRTLTEDEAKVNAAVDAIRFNGAHPSDFTLGGGWSFDENGDLCVAVTATASGNGSVSGSATVAQYSTVTLVATPASGAVFKCWTGDTDAITTGNAYSPSITVTAAGPVTLTAVFATPAASAASLYVQRGLVAAYDGIDNAGTGTHDSSATKWKNLAGDASLDGAKGASTEWTDGKGWRTTGNTKPFTVASGLASTFATTNFTMQFACVPAVANKRMCYFGQYNVAGGLNIEQTVEGKLRFYRNANNSIGQTSTHDKTVSTATVAANTYLSTAVCVSKTGLTFYNGGTLLQTINGSPGAITSASDSVIGGEVQAGSNRTSLDATYGITFRGTYHAFRVYNVTLTAAEIAWNAGLDAVRFNGADAAATLGDGYSYDAATDTLTATVSATATAGGKISYCGGAAAASVSEAINFDGSKAVAFSAIPDAGCVFDHWSGDIDLIETGTAFTQDITIDLLRPVALVANFRRLGDAADGKVFDVSFTGDATADGLTFSATDADVTQGYETANVTLPVLPTVTNANVACLYLPQPTNTNGTGTYRQMATSDKPAVTGLVATVFCRFRWDGPVLPSVANYPAVILNGYTGWSNIGNGFLVRLRSSANDSRGFFSIVVPNNAVGYDDAGITDIAGSGYVEPGEWTDCFVSVYPSPTNPTLSNADIWYCREPKWNSGGYFTAPSIGHRHFGDGCKITLIDTNSSRLSFGTEPASSSLQGADTSSEKAKCFRGAIAAAKGWNRLLSESERYTVMAGFDGVQTFNNAEIGTGRTVRTETLTTMQGQNVTGTAFLGDADTAHFQRALSSNRPYNTIKLVFDAPKSAGTSPYVYKTEIEGVKSNNIHPVHLDFNGKTVWSSANVAAGDEIRVELNEADALPGINELTWHYDTPIADNWVQFRYHRLRLGIGGMSILIR